MKIAYLVFAYRNPRVLSRTIQSLSCQASDFFVHIDKKSRIEDFAEIRGNNIFFSPRRLPVYWAEFSGVQAVLMLIRQALSKGVPYDYLVLLSGSEYPLRSRDYIHDFLARRGALEYISMVKMPSVEAGKPLSRIQTLRFPSDKPVRRLTFRLLAKVGLAQRDYRKYLGEIQAYAGHTWWALTRNACQFILNSEEANPHIAKYFANSFAPEETFFHTILGNSPFRSQIRRNLVYEDWSAGGGHPALIEERHVKLFEENQEVTMDDAYGPGEVLFARKFADDNLRLLDRIDEMIRRKEKRLELGA